jgi:ribosomal protein S18 acetylase RimI-like enzyme
MSATRLHRCAACGAPVEPERVRTVVTCGRHGEAGRERWNTPFKIRPAAPVETAELRRIVTAFFGHDDQIMFGRTFPIAEQTNLVADAGGAVAGLVSLRVDGTDGLLVALAVPPLYQGLGVGSALLSAAIQRLAADGARLVSVATTNDNAPALELYQRRGFVIEEVRPGELAAALEKRLGAVPRGLAGIPVRDEIRLRLDLVR